jgi:predicted dehydrogenase
VGHSNVIGLLCRFRTHKGPLTQPHMTHQTIQMDEMAAIILDGKQPVVPVDGEDGLKDMIIIDAFYEAVRTGRRVELGGG